MALPGYQDFMLPLLKFAKDGRDHTITEAIEAVAAQLGLSEEEQDSMLPSGTQTQLYNRVTWAVTYLRKALVFEKVARGTFRITPRGLALLAKNPARVDAALLEQFSEFQVFKTKKSKIDEGEQSSIEVAIEPDATPDERLDAAYNELRKALAGDLLDKVREGTDKFFEYLVLTVLKKMGYGGTHGERARVTGKSGDGGIDGVIPEDSLGLDMIYLQAKKWQNPVGPDEIRKFVGSLGENKAHKGVFITSGTYTSGARTAAERANARVVLIDGEQLAQLMIDHGVGVSKYKDYPVKKLDSDFFEGV